MLQVDILKRANLSVGDIAQLADAVEPIAFADGKKRGPTIPWGRLQASINHALKRRRLLLLYTSISSVYRRYPGRQTCTVTNLDTAED